MYSCGDYQNVPLVSARGGINYNPSLAHMQLAYSQGTPIKELVEPMFFYHGDQHSKLNDRISRAWKALHFKGKAELGLRAIRATPEFEKWIENRVIKRENPSFAPPDPLLKNDREEVERALAIRIEKHKDELENIQVERKRQRTELQKSKEEYVELLREISALKSKHDANSAKRKASLEKENQRLKEELKEAHYNRRKRESELYKEKEAYRQKHMQGQAHILALEEKLAKMQRTAEQTTNARILENQLMDVRRN